VRHLGKVPQALQSAAISRTRCGTFQKGLDRAIAEENFEQAALLRDEIKLLREPPRQTFKPVNP
jgi:protein-arginine kinase activator protein McsA